MRIAFSTNRAGLSPDAISDYVEALKGEVIWLDGFQMISLCHRPSPPPIALRGEVDIPDWRQADFEQWIRMGMGGDAIIEAPPTTIAQREYEPSGFIYP